MHQAFLVRPTISRSTKAAVCSQSQSSGQILRNPDDTLRGPLKRMLQRPEPAFLASSSLALGAQEAGGSLMAKALNLLTDVAMCVYTKVWGPQALASESFRSAALHAVTHGPFRGGTGVHTHGLAMGPRRS